LIGVLNLDARDDIRDDQTFASLGLDSLTALELKNHLQQCVGCSLPPTIAFEHPTIAAMAEFLDALMQAAADAAAATTSPATGRQEFGL
jgi:acyl carrier protein